MNLAQRARINLADMCSLGPGVVTRHLARLKGDRIARIRVPNAGSMLIRAGDSDIEAVRQVFVKREYDLGGAPGKRIKAKYEEILAEGGTPIIVDAGANIGAASLWFSEIYPEARIVAIEPDPGNAAMVRRNFEGRLNCMLLEAAIGAERGFVNLHSNGLSWATRTERAQSGVPTVTMDDALNACAGGTPFIAKIDIEGFEKDLFATNSDWISRFYVVMIEPHDWMLPGQRSSGPFQAAMGSHRFEIFMSGENLVYVQP